MIRWCLDRNFVVIPKSVKEQRIIENSDVYDFKLTQEDLQTMVYRYTSILSLNLYHRYFIML